MSEIANLRKLLNEIEEIKKGHIQNVKSEMLFALRQTIEIEKAKLQMPERWLNHIAVEHQTGYASGVRSVWENMEKYVTDMIDAEIELYPLKD